MPKRERKSASTVERLDTKGALTIDDEGVIEGLASVYGTVDQGGDIVRKGAFEGVTFPIPMLFDHDPSEVIGVWESATETDQGYRVKGRILSTEIQRAKEVRAMIMSKAVKGLSIGFRTLKAVKNAKGVRELLKVNLFEISVVAFPMHPGALIGSVKGAQSQVEANMETEEEKATRLELEKKAREADEKKAADALAAALKPVIARIDTVEAKANRLTGGQTEKAEPTDEQKAFVAYLQRGDLISQDEKKALTLSDDTTGGYLAPPELSSEILRDIVELSPIRGLASVRGTNSPSVIYPTRKPMGNATWNGELDTTTESTGNPFGSLEVAVHELSTFVTLSNLLMQDAPAVEAEVRAALSEDFELKETAAFLNGTGVGRPRGLMVHTGIATYKNGHATNILPDNLIKFLYSITPTYRNKGAWAMNGTTLGNLRTVKDGQNNYIWRPGLTEGQPETILGRPVVEIIDMPDVAADAFPILYGDFSGYRIVDRLALSSLVDPYTRAGVRQTVIHATRRVGGDVIMPAKFKKYQMAV